MTETKTTEAPTESLIDQRQFAKALGISLNTLRTYAETAPGFPQPRQFMGIKRWLKGDVDRWMRETFGTKED